MKERYLDIMEKSLSAYSEERIKEYIEDVRRDGLTEHGFPRLGANIGVLVALGRRRDLTNTFIEIMNICCEQIPQRKAANDFSVREICCVIMLAEKKNAVKKELIDKWKKQLAELDAWKTYEVIAKTPETLIYNWALFGAVSEYIRGILCGIDTSEFVEWQLSSQMLALDENGMYRDDPPKNPMVYDIMPRLLLSFLLASGYNGRFREKIEQALDKATPLTLKMQSVTGEVPFGGRSNQFLHNEAMEAAYFETEASRYKQKGEIGLAGKLKRAAQSSADKLEEYLSLSPISHIKNRYDINSRIGCEDYGYFNKYMITVASNIFMGYMFADDTVIPSKTANKSCVACTGNEFHKVFMRGGEYFLEFEFRADEHYDANGLGRIHKKGCSSFVCLSVPFAKNPNYKTEHENLRAASICCYQEKDGLIFSGADSDADYALTKSSYENESAAAEILCTLGNKTKVEQTYTVSASGVDITLSNGENIGFFVPVFDFDGKNNTEITVKNDEIICKYKNFMCIYRFSGEVKEQEEYVYNRNGRYRLMRVLGQKLHIEIKNTD